MSPRESGRLCPFLIALRHETKHTTGAPNPRVVDMYAAEKNVDLVTITSIVDMRGEGGGNRSPEMLKLNPSGGVPWLTFANGTTISETIADNV